MLSRPMPVEHPVPALAHMTTRAQYRQNLQLCQSALRGCGDGRLPDVSQRPEGTLRQRYAPHLHERHAQTRRARSPLWHHRPNQPHLLLRVSQRFAPHPTSLAREHPQAISRQRMDSRRAVRRLCRRLRLVAATKKHHPASLS